MKNLFNRISATLTAVIIFTLIFIFSFTMAYGQPERRVIITGKVDTPRENLHPAFACFSASDGEEMDLLVRRNGRFWVNAPEAERYTLSFMQEGSIAKQVVVDAHNAGRSVSAAKDRVIRFEVVLHTDGNGGTLRYGGPVGSVAFHHSNGRIRVAHHYQFATTEAPTLASDRKEP